MTETRIPDTVGVEVCSHADMSECYTCGEMIWVGEKKYVHSDFKWMCKTCFEWEEGDDEKYIAGLKERLEKQNGMKWNRQKRIYPEEELFGK